MIELTEHVIDYAALTEMVRDHRAGAVVLFLGTVREFTGDRQTQALQYDAFPAMARAQLERLEQECRQKFSVCGLGLIHRTGHLQLGDISVAVAVSAPHRDQAFTAGRWLIDTLKLRVPIWKQERYADGQVEWVHPEQSTASPGKSVASAGDSL